MPGIRQHDELIASTGTKHGNVRAEFSGTYVDIVRDERVLDSFQPTLFIESTRQLKLVLKVWVSHHEKRIPALTRAAKARDRVPA